MRVVHICGNDDDLTDAAGDIELAASGGGFTRGFRWKENLGNKAGNLLAGEWGGFGYAEVQSWQELDVRVSGVILTREQTANGSKVKGFLAEAFSRSIIVVGVVISVISASFGVARCVLIDGVNFTRPNIIQYDINNFDRKINGLTSVGSGALLGARATERVSRPSRLVLLWLG